MELSFIRQATQYNVYVARDGEISLYRMNSKSAASNGYMDDDKHSF